MSQDYDELDNLILNYEVDIYCYTTKNGSELDGVDEEKFSPYRVAFKAAIERQVLQGRINELNRLGSVDVTHYNAIRSMPDQISIHARIKDLKGQLDKLTETTE